MSDPVLVVRVAANLSEFQSNFREGVIGQIETSKTALTSMSTAFDGSKIIGQAGAVVTAIGGIQNVTSLTAAEQAKANTILEAAIEKYAALGKTAPASMVALADATKPVNQNLVQVDESAGSFVGSLVSGIPIVGQFIAALSVEKVAEFAAAAVAAARNIYDLSLATGVSTDGLQQLQYVGQSAGVGIDQLARGVETFSARLANGDKNATFAVQSLGLSIKDLIASGPEDAFLSFASAASKVQDPMDKAALYTDAFGARLGRLLLSLGDLTKAMSEVPQKAIISQENIQAANDLAVKWDHLKDVIGNVFTDLAVRTGEAFGIVALKSSSAAAGANALADGAKNVDIALQSDTDSAQLLENWLTQLRTAGYEPLSDSQKAIIIETEKLGASQEEIASRLGVSTAAVKLYTETYKQGLIDEKKALEDATKAEQAKLAVTAEIARAEAELYRTIGAASHDTVQAQITDTYAAAAARIAAMEKTKSYSVEAEMLIWQAADQTVSNITQKLLESDKYTREHYQLIADKAKEAYDFAMDHSDSYTRREIQNFHDAWIEAEQDVNHWSVAANEDMDSVANHVNGTTDAINRMAKAAEDAKKKAEDAKKANLDQGGSFTYNLSTQAGVDQFHQLNPAATSQLSDQQLIAFTQKGGTLQQLVQQGLINLYGGYASRDSGGSVNAGQPYYVGTGAQPELFVPQSAGTMIPAGAGGDTTISLAMGGIIDASNKRAFAKMVAAELFKLTGRKVAFR